MDVTIGVDIGGTKCLGVVLDARGVIQAEHRLQTPQTGPGLVAAVASVVAELRVTSGDGAPVGVGAPGLVDRFGTLRFTPHLPAVRDLPLLGLLAEGPLGGGRVIVENDATCAVVAESRLGVARGAADALMVTLGTGIGGGILAGGRVQRGAHGFAGEIGHMAMEPEGRPCPCGQRGCWERYASGSGLAWMAREAALHGTVPGAVAMAGGDPSAVLAEHLTAASAAGDAGAGAVMARFGRWVARGLANLANVLDPELIVIGGGLVECGSVLLAPVRAALDDLPVGGPHRPGVTVVGAAFGSRAGAVGAALLARP